MKDKFQDMENYTSIIKVNPDIYGFINIAALVGKNNSKIAYRIRRTVEYRASFSAFRDRMFAGLMSVYNKIFDLLNGKPLNNGSLKNYYLVAVETANDFPRRILSFDMYMIQANNFKDLLEMPEFKNLPHITEKNIHAAIFAFGYQYDKDMASIDITNKVFHIKAFKDDTNPIKVYNFNDTDNIVYDTDNTAFQQFLATAFDELDKNIYYIGLTMEDYTHDSIDHQNNSNEKLENINERLSDNTMSESQTNNTKKFNSRGEEIQEIETINIDDVLKPASPNNSVGTNATIID